MATLIDALNTDGATRFWREGWDNAGRSLVSQTDANGAYLAIDDPNSVGHLPWLSAPWDVVADDWVTDAD